MIRCIWMFANLVLFVLGILVYLANHHNHNDLSGTLVGVALGSGLICLVINYILKKSFHDCFAFMTRADIDDRLYGLALEATTPAAKLVYIQMVWYARWSQFYWGTTNPVQARADIGPMMN